MPAKQVAEMDLTQADRNRDMAATARALADWLSRADPRFSGATVELDYPRGAGTSNETLLLNVRSAGGDTRMVLRPHPGEFQLFLDPAFERQVEVMRALRNSGQIPVPEIFGIERDPDVLGTPFYVMEFIPGRTPNARPPYNATGWLADASPAQRETLWISAMDAFCAIHTIPVEPFGFVHRPTYGATGFEDEFNYWMSACEWSCGERTPTVIDKARQWLLANRPAAPADGLSWGDARIGNMIFGDDFKVAAVIDWEQASLGGACQDLGWWLFTDETFSSGMGLKRLEGLGGRHDTIAFWEERTGQRADDLTWYEAYAGFKLAVILTRKLRLEGKPAVAGMNANNNPFTRVLSPKLDLAPPIDEA
jgi:aminoglycoside phosphotransferase (APT) family kinase protein